MHAWRAIPTPRSVVPAPAPEYRRSSCSAEAHLRRLAFAITCLLLAACGDPFTPTTVAGTYTLVSIDGELLPYTATSDEGVALTVNASSLVLTGASTVTLTAWWVMTYGEETDSIWGETAEGTYTLTEPSTITFSWDGWELVTTGRLVGDRLTWGWDFHADWGGVIWVFEKGPT